MDVSSKNLESAKKHWNIINHKEKIFKFRKNFKDLPKKLDLVIIASTADNRHQIIVDIKKKSKIKYCILEKPVSTDSLSLTKISKILNKKKTFVNISRVYSKNYLIVRKNISNKRDLTLTVSGHSWNLASNAIHYLYLYFWLKNIFVKKKINFFLKIKSSYETKRKNFFDFYGSLKVSYCKNKIIELQSVPKTKNIKNNFVVKINSGTNKWKINELNNKLYLNNKFIYHDKNFYQSLITKKIVTNLLYKKKTELPSLDKIFFFQKKLLIIFEKSFSLYRKIT